MCHWMLEYFHDYTNDDHDLWLTFAFFLLLGQIWGNAGTYDFVEKIEDFGLNIGMQSCLNEHVNL